MRRLPLALVATYTLAAAAPATLTMRYTASTNLHLAGGRGAMSWRADATIAVTLARGGKLVATSRGTTVDHDLDGGASSRNTDDTATWTTRWTGTWARTGSTLTLDLVRADHACKRERVVTAYDVARKLWVEYTPERLPCKTATKQSRLTCTSERVQLGTADKPRLAPAWRCTVASGELAETPVPWVLGRSACIEVIGGKMTPLAYATCKP